MTEVNPVKEVAYGAISGICGKFIEYPLDTVKVRIQLSKQSHIGAWKTINSIFHNEGIYNGFYKGIKAPLAGACFETAVLFTSYNYALLFLHPKSEQLDSASLLVKCASGGLSGVAGTIVLTPVELVKCQMQVSNLVKKTQPQNITYGAVIKDILRTDGVTGLFKGFQSTLIREVVGTAIWFGTFESVNQYLEQKYPNKDWTVLLSGAAAGITFNTSIFPIDTIKSNIQTYDIYHPHQKGKELSTWKMSSQLVKELGILRLYNGLGITLIRAVPANAIIFYTYEFLKKNF